ncbi:hypothetical protein [Methylovirgula sp. HY1]|uniref:hypothetical protein n=1 Tax=Methylovirgula sp. HY1 TaxID=2822761 RepID=UPI001C5BB39E|nr:hypothetical protein [Methylovirgula sp. HY1]QXX75515.1 hypothetical protein MHY1_02336 [Methylovirgula sp. HY1]
MMTFDEKDRNRRRDEAAEWSWYSVERGNPGSSVARATLVGQIGARLRMIYGISAVADEPAAMRLLLAKLDSKGI